MRQTERGGGGLLEEPAEADPEAERAGGASAAATEIDVLLVLFTAARWRHNVGD